MTRRVFYRHNACTVRHDPIAPKVGSPSQFYSDRDLVNISDIVDIAFLFLGNQGNSGITSISVLSH